MIFKSDFPMRHEVAKVQDQAEDRAVSDRIIAGAIFDFLGFLTTRDKPTSFGATELAWPAATLLQEWATIRGVDINQANVESWQDYLGLPTDESPKEQGQ